MNSKEMIIEIAKGLEANPNDDVFQLLYRTLFFIGDMGDMTSLVSVMSSEKQQLLITRINENLDLFGFERTFTSFDEFKHAFETSESPVSMGDMWTAFIGLFLGYPTCCIIDFIESGELEYAIIREGYYQLNNKGQLPWWSGSGFVPCESCSHEQESLINKVNEQRVYPVKFKPEVVENV